jgi:two-component system chemotaxis response regulator CheB
LLGFRLWRNPELLPRSCDPAGKGLFAWDSPTSHPMWQRPTAVGGVSVPNRKTTQSRSYRDIIVIGASAGGVEALIKIVSLFPRANASVLAVLHTRRNGPGVLPIVLSRHSQNLSVEAAQDGLEIRPGHFYIAVPDYHLLLERGYMRLAHGPLENRHRPSIDALFRSAARAYGPRVIGVVLSGYLDDGSAGLHSIKKAGGLAVVQDPKDALVPGMPQNAIATTAVDYVAPIEEIPDLLDRLAGEQVEKGVEEGEDAAMGASARRNGNRAEMVDPKGEPSAYTCPECNGTLWEVQEGNMLRYACRVGHSFSAESMLQDQSDSAERAVWAALRALEERADLSRRMAQRSLDSGLHELSNRYAELAASADNDASVLRRLLLENRPMQTYERGDDLAKTA